jgi:hypothetical protein
MAVNTLVRLMEFGGLPQACSLPLPPLPPPSPSLSLSSPSSLPYSPGIWLHIITHVLTLSHVLSLPLPSSPSSLSLLPPSPSSLSFLPLLPPYPSLTLQESGSTSLPTCSPSSVMHRA